MTSNRVYAALSRIGAAQTFTYVDCGARGDRAPDWLLRTFKNATYVGLEADAAECARLQARNRRGHRYIAAFLGRARETRPFHVTANPACSSLLTPNDEVLHAFQDLQRFFAVERVETVGTIPLDECLSAHGIDAAHFLELDTQGTELDILQGAERYLTASIVGVQIEVEFSPMYRQQPLFGDVDAYLRATGFQLFDLSRYHARRKSLDQRCVTRGQLLWGHALYLRDHRRINASTPLSDGSTAQLALVAAALGFPDYSTEIIDAMTAANRQIDPLWRALRKELNRENLPRMARLIERAARWRCGRLLQRIDDIAATYRNAYTDVTRQRKYAWKD